MKKRIISILLTVFVLIGALSVIPPMAVAAAEGGDGIGSVENHTPTGTPISDWSELIDSAGNYYLTANITVGSTFSSEFTGTLDGNGHTVTTSVPLFATVSGTVKNLTVEGTVSVNGLAAAVAQTSNGGTFKNILNTASVTSTSTSSTASENAVGGIFALGLGESTVADCKNTGAVSGHWWAAGIAANMSTGSGGTLKAESCYNTGNITSGAKEAGGIIGHGGSIGINVTDCHNSGTVSGHITESGGIVGYVLGPATVKNCTNSGTVKNTATGNNQHMLGGIIGGAESSLYVESCTNSADISASGTYNGKNPNAGIAIGGIVGYCSSSEPKFVNCKNSGELKAEVTATNKYGRASVGGILGMQRGGSTVYFEYCENTGTIGATASIANSELICVGGIYGGARHNTSYGSGNKSYGVDMRYCVNSGNVSGDGWTGGLTGASFRSGVDNQLFVAKNCLNTGDVDSTKGEYGAGGIVGYLYGYNETTYADIQNCVVTGEVKAGTATNSCAGGLVGKINISATAVAGIFKNNVVSGTVSGSADNITAVIENTVKGGMPATCTGNYYTNSKTVYAVNGSTVTDAILSVDLNDSTYSVAYNASTTLADAIAAVNAAARAADDEITADLYVMKGDEVDKNWSFGGVPLKEGIDLEWYNKDGNDFTINTAAEFLGFAALVTGDAGGTYAADTFEGKTVNLGASISFDGVAFAPVGTLGVFNGTFDGKGYVVSDISYDGAANVGLFGILGGNATVKNVVVLNADLSATGNAVGGAVGLIQAGSGADDTVTISNVYVKGDLSSARYCGGILGSIRKNSGQVNLSNCVFDGTAEATTDYVGGIVGYAAGSTLTVSDCLNMGMITAVNHAAGILGGDVNSSMASSLITLKNCMTLGEFTIITDNTRDFVSSYFGTGTGTAQAVVVNNCYCRDDSEATYFTRHAIINGSSEVYDKDSKSEVEAAVGKLTVSLQSLRGTEATYPSTGEGVDWSAWTTRDRDVMVPVTDSATRQNLPMSVYYVTGQIIDGATLGASGGNGSVDTPYIINSLAALNAFASRINAGDLDSNGGGLSLFSELYYVLGGNLTVNGEWTAIGTENYPFRGSFDGKNYTVSGINMSGTGSLGLFGVIAGGTEIKNLSIVNCTFTNTDENGSTGALVGLVIADGTVEISGIYSGANVSGISDCGGIVGLCRKGSGELTVSSCVFNGSVKATASSGAAGGVVAHAAGASLAVSDCLNLGTVEGGYAAGIVGLDFNKGETGKAFSISRCINLGNISADSAPREIVTSYYGSGNNSSYPAGTVTDCYGVHGNVLLARHCKINGVGANDNGGMWNTTEPEGTDLEFKYLAELVGTDAALPADSYSGSWSTVLGDFFLPTAAMGVTPQLYVPSLEDGASVRISDSVSESGIRFTATVNKEYADLYNEFGIVIVPTDYLTETNGVFTMAALDALAAHTVKYEKIKAELFQNGENDSYYLFTGALKTVREENYERDFSAILYFIDNEGNVTYGTYNEEKNSRSVSYVASKALEDLKTEGGNGTEYPYETLGVYSRFTEAQRQLLGLYASSTDLAVISYNICAENVSARVGEMETYLESLAADKDIIGLQEYNKDWENTGILGKIDGFTLIEDTVSMFGTGLDDTWHIACPILYRADRYDVLASGAKSFGGRASYAIFEDKITGAVFMYVNVHTDADDGKNDLTNMMDWVNGTLRTGDYADIPVIVGGDTNVSGRDDVAAAIGGDNVTYKYAQDHSMVITKKNDPTKVSGVTNGEVDYQKEVTYSNGKYHGILAGSMLDRYFVTTDCKVTKSVTPHDTSNGNVEGDFLSDHVPLLMYAVIT